LTFKHSRAVICATNESKQQKESDNKLVQSDCANIPKQPPQAYNDRNKSSNCQFLLSRKRFDLQAPSSWSQFSISNRLALAIPSTDKGYSKCTMYAVNFTEKRLQGIVEADPSWPVQSCSFGWEYNYTEIPYSTIATEVSFSTVFALTCLLIFASTERLGVRERLLANACAINLLPRSNRGWPSVRLDR